MPICSRVRLIWLRATLESSTTSTRIRRSVSSEYSSGSLRSVFTPVSSASTFSTSMISTSSPSTSVTAVM